MLLICQWQYHVSALAVTIVSHYNYTHDLTSMIFMNLNFPLSFPVAKEPYKVSVCVSVCVSLHITGLHALSPSAFTCTGTRITKIFKTAKVKIDSQVYAIIIIWNFVLGTCLGQIFLFVRCLHVGLVYVHVGTWRGSVL